MDFLFSSDIMHGGDGWKNNLTGLFYALLYLAVMCALWYVYYIKFEDRPGWAKNGKKTSEEVTLFWVYKISALGIIALIALLIFLAGWNRPNPSDPKTQAAAAAAALALQQEQHGGVYSGWVTASRRVITPLTWLSTGFLGALVVSQTTIKDLMELNERKNNAVGGFNADPSPKTT
jgi:hypothetical protein